jgi:predicted O-linked N-acetylglucosamine transferase (SPINDLY family)
LQLTQAEPRKILAHKLVSTAFELFHKSGAGLFAIQLAERCQATLAGDLEALQVLVGLYISAGMYDRAIANAELYYRSAQTKFQKLFASYLNQNTYLTSGNWDNYLERHNTHRQLVRDVIANAHELPREPQKQHLIATSYLSFYTSDAPEIDRPLQNHMAQIYQDNLPQFTSPRVEGTALPKTPNRLRIGYLASTLKQHSVGWMSRWVFHYHDRRSLQIFTYCLNQSADDPFNHQWFRDKVDAAYYCKHPHEAIAQIRADEIDILIDRQALDIPADAIVYLSTQAGFKRHPANIRSQMQIIAAVPNSYLLIKGKSDPTMIRELFGNIATAEGVSIERLRFLPHAPTEYIHRANLAIADIVLDTFPYNGATTTLETLWMGIPLVTQVGQQFAARNSYTFMLNADIEAGIAWSAAEYIEWGIKLGRDSNLRREIGEKLRASRRTAPVWNAQQFTLDLERAYRQMWAKYQAQS